MYWLLYYAINKKGVPACHKKWNDELDLDIDDVGWSIAHKSPFQATHETAIQSFQYKVINRIIPRHHWLHIMKIKPSPNCELCDVDDTLIHYFVSCRRVKHFWNSFAVWWYTLTKRHLEIEPATIIFGIPENSNHVQVLNFCLIIAKYHIYQVKQGSESKYVTLYDFLCFLKSKLELEHINAELKMESEKFEKKWAFVFDSL